MSQAIILKGGAGGVGSDDVTASKAQVLQGYRTVTTDSDDEVIEGEIVNRGTFVIASEVVNAPGESTVHVRFEEGYYNKDGQYKPTAKIPYAVLPNVLGIDANKMLESLTIAGTRGTIPARGYHGPNGIEFWLYPQEGGFVVRLEEGFYSKDAGSGLKPYVIVPTDMVINAVGYNPDKTLNDTEVCGVRGNIPIRGNVVNTAEFVDAHWEQSLLARFEFGYYVQNGQWKPTIKIPYSTAASVLGVDANKMLKSLKIAGVQGNLDDRGSYVTASGIWYFGADNYLVAQIPPGLYGGGNGNGKTNVNILRQDLINALGLNPDMWLDSFQTMGIQGKIPRWICTTGDVISAVNGEGFAWDDIYAGRGRGIVMKILNGGFIQDANYAFLASPNLYPQNIRAGVNINGVVGTMPDYSTGRTVFNGATFDNVLVSGVATKGFSHNGVYYAYVLQSGYGYGGIYGGGMNLQVTTTYPALRSRRIGCALSQSINVTPFRQIVVYYRSVANIKGSPYVSFEAHIIRASLRGQVYIGDQLVDTVAVIRQGEASPAINHEGQIVLNVEDINEYIFLSFGAFCNQDKAGDVFAGAVQITRIDFLN